MTPWNLRDKVRRLPAGEVIVHVVIFILGAAFIVLGFTLVVLPGPLTIPPILVGLALWSLEFDFAERLLVRVKAQAHEAWAMAKAKPIRTGLVTGGGVALAVGALYGASRLGWIDRVKDVFS